MKFLKIPKNLPPIITWDHVLWDIPNPDPQKK